MVIQITAEDQQKAVASIQRFFEKNMEEPLGNMAAAALFDFFMQELAPLAYNRGVCDVRDRLQARLMDVEGEVYAEEFQYWQAVSRKKRGQ